MSKKFLLLEAQESQPRRSGHGALLPIGATDQRSFGCPDPLRRRFRYAFGRLWCRHRRQHRQQLNFGFPACLFPTVRASLLTGRLSRALLAGTARLSVLFRAALKPCCPTLSSGVGHRPVLDCETSPVFKPRPLGFVPLFPHRPCNRYGDARIVAELGELMREIGWVVLIPLFALSACPTKLREPVRNSYAYSFAPSVDKQYRTDGSPVKLGISIRISAGVRTKSPLPAQRKTLGAVVWPAQP